VALLFLLPSLALSLLLQYAFSLVTGGGPFVAAFVLALPWIGAARDSRTAFGRGLLGIAALSLLFAAVVHLRLWTNAGGPVLAREGLLGVSRWALLLGLAAGGLGSLLLRTRAERAPDLAGPAA
jgi:hypothetical protein